MSRGWIIKQIFVCVGVHDIQFGVYGACIAECTVLSIVIDLCCILMCKEMLWKPITYHRAVRGF